MQHKMAKQSGLFVYLLLLTCCFVFFEISLLFQYSNVFLSDYNLIAAHLKIPASVLPGILFFLTVQIFLHLFFTFCIWSATRLISRILHLTWKQTEKFGFFLWISSLITVLLANQYLAPNSKFAMVTEILITPTANKIILILFGSIILIAICVALWSFFFYLSKRLKWFYSLIFLTLIISLQFYPQKIIIDAASANKPNIIVIGIDSLRPDFLGFFGYEKQTPHLDRFLTQATVFADSFTPLARTFPAWVSILTGQYPLHNGARTNLVNPTHIKLQETLPQILQIEGYHTLFATDETRFSNITTSFGFDRIISAPMGFNDFLLGTINDFPLSNIVVNTRLGKYLFPYSYANRPAITYDPNSFLHLLEPELQNRNQPLFLAIHLCLPHFPYTWGTEISSLIKPYHPLHDYHAAIARVDHQFSDLLNLLRQNKLLEHSIVVLLSDHGEAIELQGDRITNPDLFIAGKNKSLPYFYPPNMKNESLDRSAGHGTDVLGLTQYHNLLAFKLYGLKPQSILTATGIVSLLDIKPTILDIANIPLPKNNDGISLKNIILGQATKVPQHDDFFLESDFSPAAIHSVHPETRQLLFEGIDYFEIDPLTARLHVRPNMEKLIYSSKQFATIYKQWELAFYPQENQKRLPILVNLKTGEWTNDLTTPFAKSAPISHMNTALSNFFHRDFYK